MGKRTTDACGAPFRLGVSVQVVAGCDETFNPEYLGSVGVIVHFDYDCGCGQAYPNDPMIGVAFSDGKVEEFWAEELSESSLRVR